MSNGSRSPEISLFSSPFPLPTPVLCVVFLWVCSLLVSGSADKNNKIWGLDFGDCHRLLQAHSDSVSCLGFQPHTHYFLSAGRDGVLKYCDAVRLVGIGCFCPFHGSACNALG